MKWKNTADGYGSIPVALHWLTVILIGFAYATMELDFIADRGTPLRLSMKTWHYMAGISVFALTWLRLLLRQAGSTPLMAPTPSRMQTMLATAVKIALYGLMLLLPLIGWLTVNAKGHEVVYFGYVLPALMAENPGRADLFKEVHETLASIGYFVIGLHAAAALFHHYIKRDSTMRMMWFRR